MKKPIFLFCIMFSYLSGDVPDWTKQDAYIQLSSVTTQIPVAGVKSRIVADSIDLIKNFEVSPNKDAVICQIPGTYFITTGTQPATMIRGISGYVDSWYELNGVQIPTSNSRQYVDENSRVAQTSNGILLQLNTNDVLSTGFLASDANIGIIFIQSTLSSEPSVTSYIFSAFKLY